MKKLLVLMLVLGITTAANAALQLSFNGDTGVEEADVCIDGFAIIDVYSDDAMPYGAWLEVVGPGTFTGNYTVYPEAGPDAYVDGSYLPDWWYGEAVTFNPDNPIIPGRHFDFEFQCTGAGDATVNLYAADAAALLDSIVIHQVPEPASMLLLGLGGLLLRRRK